MKNSFTFKQVFHWCLMLMFVHVQLIQAQWSENPAENTLITNATKDQGEACIVSDGLGNIIIGWRDMQFTANDALGGTIYAQKLNNTGVAQWQVNGIRVNTSASDDGHTNPLMVKSEDGNVIAVWQKNGSDATKPMHLYAQKTNNDGSRLWNNDVRVFNVYGWETMHTIFTNGANGVFVACSYASSGWASPKDIIAQNIDPSGAVLWGSTGINVCNATGNQSYVKSTSNFAGDVYFVWQDLRNLSLGEIYAQRINYSGTPLWDTNGIKLKNNTSGMMLPEVINDGYTGIIVAWEEYISGIGYYLFVQRLNESGELLWGDDGIQVCNESYYNPHTIVSDGNGGAIISWVDKRSGNEDIYAQRVDKDGIVKWTANGVPVITAQGTQTNPEIIPDGAGGAIVTWWEYQSGTEDNVYAQRLNGDGNKLWANNGVTLSTAANYQRYPKLISDGDEGAIVVWEDNRNGADYDIYTQYIDKNGNLGGTATMMRPQNKNSLLISNVFPNPAITLINISFSIPQNENTNIRIYDISGRMISQPVSGMMNSGMHTTTWDIEKAPAGVYLIRLTAGQKSLIRKIVIK